MSDSKNLFLAMILSAIVLLGWSFVADRFFPTPAPQATEAGSTASSPQATAPAEVSAASPAAAPAAPKVLRDRARVLAETPRIRIQTPSLQGSINLKGAQIDDLTLVRHRQTIDGNSQPVRLLSPLGAADSYVAVAGWTVEGAPAPTLDTVWTADRQVLTPTSPVTLTSDVGGVTYQLRIAVDDGYLFSIEQRAINRGSEPVVVRPIGLVSRASKSSDVSRWTNHVGPISVFGGAANYDIDYKTLDEGAPQSFPNVKGWLGFTDHFWLAALAPANQVASADFRKSPAGGYQADYALAAKTLAPGQSTVDSTRLFAGAKEYDRLKAYQAAGIDQLPRAIDWGWFRWFMLPIFDLLLFLFRTFGNFGFAIIGLTLIVRLIMFPIAQKQFQSMAAMRKLQPKLKAVQEKWKDDKARQQQEVLKLYQSEKVNPAAGCLPILIQIPVFYALYKVLMVSVEMRHQPFILWIKDLSAPDPLTPINLFGLLDFTPPAMLAIGVLPILVGATQWASMKLNPQPMDPVQQQIFAWMPWVLVFVMAPFAAGLQLYWMTNNLLTIAQQWWLYRRFGLHFSDTHPVET